MSLGFAKAVTQAVAHDTDRWLLYMPREVGKRSGRILGSLLSTSTEGAMRGTTRDQLDAAVMSLCNDDNDDIRRIFREGI